MPHLCHALGCQVAVPPKLLMCRRHWFMVPRELQRGVWAEYRPGQEVDKNPTSEYLLAAHRAVLAVAVKEGKLTVELARRLLEKLEKRLASLEGEPQQKGLFDES